MLLVVRVLDWSRTHGTAPVIRPDYLSVCARRWFQRSGKRLFPRPGLGSELSPLAGIGIVWAGTAIPSQGVMCKGRWIVSAVAVAMVKRQRIGCGQRK